MLLISYFRSSELDDTRTYSPQDIDFVAGERRRRSDKPRRRFSKPESHDRVSESLSPQELVECVLSSSLAFAFVTTDDLR